MERMLTGSITFDASQTTKLTPPPDNTDAIIADFNIGITAMFGIGMAATKVPWVPALVVGTILEVPFCMLSILRKEEAGQSVIEANLSSVGESTFAILLGAKMEGIGGAIAAPIISNLLSSTAEKYFSNDENALNSLMNSINSTTFKFYNDGTTDVSSTITAASGINDLKMLLDGSGMPFGNITIQSSAPLSAEYIADTFKSYATLTTEIDSPLGKYIIGSNGSDSLTGSEPNSFGIGGNDTLYGGDGADIIHGGGGNDLIYGINQCLNYFIICQIKYGNI